jgi:hypothetical protein
MEETYNQRLLQLADFIDGIKNLPTQNMIDVVELVALEEKVRIHYKVMYRFWVFEELPAVFDEWYYYEMNGNAVCTGTNPEEGTVAAVIDWFGLNQDEFCHCFDLEGFQMCERFGGEKLNFESQGTEIARNIVELVKRRREKNEQ